MAIFHCYVSSPEGIFAGTPWPSVCVFVNNAAQENAECRNRIDVVRRERLQLIQANGQPVAPPFLRVTVYETSTGEQNKN